MTFFLFLKVSESQKQFFLKLHSPKNEQNIRPNFVRAEFVKYFVRFLGNGVSRKIAFEIYWPLTFPLTREQRIPNRAPPNHFNQPGWKVAGKKFVCLCFDFLVFLLSNNNLFLRNVKRLLFFIRFYSCKMYLFFDYFFKIIFLSF